MGLTEYGVWHAVLFLTELCRNKPYNNRSDVWAMGVVLYELATGKHPFDGNSMTQLMQRIVRNSVPSVPSNYSKEMRQLCDLCLQKDPSRRPNIKQLLAHPCVRTALEKRQFMLATQAASGCRISLTSLGRTIVNRLAARHQRHNDRLLRRPHSSSKWLSPAPTMRLQFSRPRVTLTESTHLFINWGSLSTTTQRTRSKRS